VARPIPELAPVMIAVLPARRLFIDYSPFFKSSILIKN